MTETERKFYQNSSKSWLSAVRSMETRGKKQLLPSNGNLYHYGGNNPVKYTDPDGKFIQTILSWQHQNSLQNKNATIGQYQSYSSKQYGETENSVGNFGCLFTCFVNVGNSYNIRNSNGVYEEKTVAELASNDDYFTFAGVSRIGGAPTDFGSSTKNLKKLLFDMTGENLEVSKYYGGEKNAMLFLAQQADKEAYVIGQVKTKNGGTHFINITGVKSDGSMNYFDPYSYNNTRNKKEYKKSDLIAIYLIYKPEGDNQ